MPAGGGGAGSSGETAQLSTRVFAWSPLITALPVFHHYSDTMNDATVDHEVGILVEALKRIAEPQADGSYKTIFIQIFKDEKLEQQLV